MQMDWRVFVVDEARFCVVGTLDLTFDECRDLSNKSIGIVRIPQRTLASIGSFEVEPEPAYAIATVRGQQFYKVDSKGREHSMLFAVVSSDGELDTLRRTGRFREWDADLREKASR